MTPLEAARTLAELDGTYDNGFDYQNCIGCDGYYEQHGSASTARRRDHGHDCLLRALPVVIAAIEAVDGYLKAVMKRRRADGHPYLPEDDAPLLALASAFYGAPTVIVTQSID